MQTKQDYTPEKIYIIQPVTEQNASNYRVLQQEAISLIESAGALTRDLVYKIYGKSIPPLL